MIRILKPIIINKDIKDKIDNKINKDIKNDRDIKDEIDNKINKDIKDIDSTLSQLTTRYIVSTTITCLFFF